MEERASGFDAEQAAEALGFENTGCSLLVASAVAAAAIRVCMGPFGLFAFPFVFFITLLVAALIGLPLLLVAIHFRRANVRTAALCGFIAGAAVPTLVSWRLNGDGWGIALLGAAGALGGIVFWRRATAPQRLRLD